MTAPNIVLWVYIVLLVAGGLVGFLKAGSKASLIASSVFALPLVLVALGLVPAIVAEVVLGILLVYMGMKFSKSKKFMPSGLMAILSLSALALRFFLK
ncbi:MAG: TMEM14 family protein [Limisphaerales bacterium]